MGLGLFGDISGERKEGRENGCWENDGLAGGFREKIVGGGGTRESFAIRRG